MIALLASLLCLIQEVRAVVEPAPVARPLPAGSELRLHDASALTGHTELARALTALRGVKGLARDAAAVEDLARLAEARRKAEEIAEGVALTMGARLELVGGQELRHLGEGQLALLASPEQQERLAVALAQAAGFQDMIQVEAKLHFGPTIDLPAAATERGLVLAEPHASELGHKIQRSSREFVSAPIIQAWPWREARLAVLDKVPYIKDYTLTRVPDLDLEIADPEIAVLELGLDLTVRCAPAGPGSVAVLVDFTYRRLAEPLRDFETTVGRSPTPVTIQLASVLTVGFEGSFELAEKETLLLVGGEGDERVALLVNAKRVPR